MMENKINVESGERLSFYSLFEEKGYHIEIPIIQRDYAQGRESKAEIRDTFLEALYNYLEEGRPHRDLDFVYGTIIEGEFSKFIPLDGQQRLTTLFLLHWYLAHASGNFSQFRQVIGRKKGSTYKSKFTYETRTSSREFCDELIAKDIDLDSLLKPDNGKNNSLSKTIQNMGWYYRSWNYDPTIQSMLNMLDALHIKFADRGDFYSKLTEEMVITFQFLNLQEFKLTDDLYIKMNARGKSLTPFENFKAKFEQYLSLNNTKEQVDREFSINYKGEEKRVSLREYFSYKIDVEWTNLFWQYKDVITRKKDAEEDNDYDDEIMNLIRVLSTNYYASTYEPDDNLEYLRGTDKAKRLKGYSDELSFNKYKDLNCLSLENVYNIIDSIDSLYNGGDKIKTHLQDTFYFDEDSTFRAALSHELSSPRRVQFYAYIQYLVDKSNNISGLHQWMRFVHNMTENTIIDTLDMYANAIKFVDRYLPYSDNILNSLSNDIDSINKRQLKEERIKALLINKSDEWKNAIEKSERQVFFKGQVGFVLEFSKILSFYNKLQSCNWSDDDNIEYLKRFKHYSNNAAALFELYESTMNDKFFVERAILSKGNYLIPASRDRYNFSSNDKIKNYDRDYSWKRLLRTDDNEWWTNRREYIKSVLDDENFNKNDVRVSLEKIINKSDVSNWRKYFIRNPQLMKYCKQGFIYKTKDEFYLLGESQLNHYHRELYSYILFINCNKIINEFSPFTSCGIVRVKSREGHSYAKFQGLELDNMRFIIEVYYTKSQNFLSKPYQVRFYTLDSIDVDDYPVSVLEILAKSVMKWKENEDWEGYWTCYESEEEAIVGIKELCDKLRVLL